MSDTDAMDDAPATDDSLLSVGDDREATDALLVTATAESTGKTAITLALGLLARERGLTVRYMKPKGTRLESAVGKTPDTDPVLAREVLDLDDELHEMEPVVYSPTFVESAVRGRERPSDLHAEVRECYDRLAGDADLVLVEGGGKHTTGGVVDLTDVDVAALLDARTVVVGEYDAATDLDDLLAAIADVRAGSDVVAGGKPDRVGGRDGAPHDIDGVGGDAEAEATAASDAEAENAAFDDAESGDCEDDAVSVADGDAAADRLVGVLFNRVPESDYDEVDTDVSGFLNRRDVAVSGVLPRVRELSGVAVAELASELGAERLTAAPGGESSDGAGRADAGRPDFVERFHVGATTGDTALRHFRRTRDAAVVTGGDRADVQTAAIEATGVTCLVLTGGVRPSDAVLGRAEEAGLPVLAVDVDTPTAVERAETVVSGGRTRDAYAVERMRELLSQYADVDSLLGTTD